MDQSKENLLLEKRIEVLKRFYDALARTFHGKPNSEDRSFLNRNLIAVRNAVREAGTRKLIHISPPPAIGGVLMKNVDPFDNLFESFYGQSLIPDAMDSVEQAIGVYEHMSSDEGLVTLNPKETIDIESAIERALRGFFQSGPLSLEKDVQDAIENILRVLGLDFTREREVAPVGAKAFRPDFIVTLLDLAIEVKLAKPGHGAAEIQEEITADIAACKTKWRQVMVVIYDLGVIVDPYQLRTSNLKLFGVSVVVVKQ